jgi:hypothetical protein
LSVVWDNAWLDLTLAAFMPSPSTVTKPTGPARLRPSASFGQQRRQGQCQIAGGSRPLSTRCCGRSRGSGGGRQAVVHHGLVAGLAVDRQAQVIDCNGQAINTHKAARPTVACAVVSCEPALPATCSVNSARPVPSLGSCQCLLPPQGAQLAAANEQHVHIDQVSSLSVAPVVLDAGQLDSLGGFMPKSPSTWRSRTINHCCRPRVGRQRRPV